MSINSDFKFNCLFCLLPLKKESKFSINEDAELIEFLAKSHSSEIKSISPLYFHQAFSSAHFCKICNDKLSEIRLIIDKIRSLESKVKQLSSVLSSKLLQSHKNYKGVKNTLKGELQSISNIRNLLYAVEAQDEKSNKLEEIKIETNSEEFLEFTNFTNDTSTEDIKKIKTNLTNPNLKTYSTTDPFEKILKVSLTRLNLHSLNSIEQLKAQGIKIVTNLELLYNGKKSSEETLETKKKLLKLDDKNKTITDANQIISIIVPQPKLIELKQEELDCSYDGSVSVIVNKEDEINNLPPNPASHQEIVIDKASAIAQSVIKCLYCDLNFTTTEAHSKHESLHTNPLFQCSFCTKKYTSKFYVDLHEKTHRCNSSNKSQMVSSLNQNSKNRNQIYFCSICNNNFSNKFNLKRHNRIYHPNVIETTGTSGSSAEKIISEKINHVQIESVEEPPVSNSPHVESTNSPQINLLDNYENTQNRSYISSASSSTSMPKMLEFPNCKKIETTIVNSSTCFLCEPNCFFSDQSNLNEHNNKVHFPFQCQICLYRFKSEEILNCHMVLKHGLGELRISCDICFKKFLTQYEFSKHKQRAHKEFPCSQCTKIMKSNNSLQNHIARFHVEKNVEKFKCSFCSKFLLTSKSKEIHERFHTKDFPFQCPECPRKFSAQEYLSRHLNIHKNRFKCSVCSKSFRSSSCLKKHEPAHERASTKKDEYECDLCGFKCKHKTGLISHSWLKHAINTEGERKFPSCELCLHRCYNEGQLENHKVKKHGIGEYKHFCETCGKGYCQESDLKRHVDHIHLKIRNFPCPHCEFRLFTKVQLLRHIERHHNQNRERKFKCSFCFKGFYEQKCCQNHEKIHMEDRPFPCSQCDKRFPTKGYLGLHIYTIHENRKGRKRKKRVKKLTANNEQVRINPSVVEEKNLAEVNLTGST